MGWMGYGQWAMGYGQWAMGYGVWAMWVLSVTIYICIPTSFFVGLFVSLISS